MKNIELNTADRELFYIELENYLVVAKLRDSFICEWSYKRLLHCWQRIRIALRLSEASIIIKLITNKDESTLVAIVISRAKVMSPIYNRFYNFYKIQRNQSICNITIDYRSILDGFVTPTENRFYVCPQIDYFANISTRCLYSWKPEETKSQKSISFGHKLAIFPANTSCGAIHNHRRSLERVSSSM